MGNTLGKRSFKRDNSLSRRSQASSSSARGLSRLSSGVSRLSARVGLRRQYVAASKAEAANSRHALEQRLAEIIMVSGRGGAARASGRVAQVHAPAAGIVLALPR